MEAEVKLAIKRKTPGPDGIVNKLIKYAANTLYRPLAFLFT